jgi:hypothetical protein
MGLVGPKEPFALVGRAGGVQAVVVVELPLVVKKDPRMSTRVVVVDGHGLTDVPLPSRAPARAQSRRFAPSPPPHRRSACPPLCRVTWCKAVSPDEYNYDY